MRKRQMMVGLLAYVALTLFTAISVSAQSVATKDLTEIADVSSERVETPEPKPIATNSDGTDCFFGIRDGVIRRDPPEKLQFEIVSTEPRLVYDKTAMTITVRLKNVGDQAVLIPWETQQIEYDIDPATGDTSYESATIKLTFGTLKDRKDFSYLKGEATLVAAPSRREQHVELLSGQWVEVKFKATLECSSNESWSCKPFHADEHAQFTVHWWEWLFTHEEKGCGAWQGAYKSRDLDSTPMELVYVALPPADANNGAAKQ